MLAICITFDSMQMSPVNINPYILPVWNNNKRITDIDEEKFMSSKTQQLKFNLELINPLAFMIYSAI